MLIKLLYAKDKNKVTLMLVYNNHYFNNNQFYIALLSYLLCAENILYRDHKADAILKNVLECDSLF